jgi:hypothetical protein
MAMHRSAVVVAAALGLVAAVCRLVPAQSQYAAEEQAKAATKWEYATLTVMNSERVYWTTADEEAEAGDWKELARQLKIPVKDRGPGQGTVKMTVFNYLGSQGWELATHTMTLTGEGTQTRRTEIWTFKRPVL